MHAAERDVDVPHLDERHALLFGLRGLSGDPGFAHVPHAVRWSAHLPRRRLIVSKPTATTRTMPATMFCVGEFAPTNASPYERVARTIAPSTAPGIVPMPPANDVPPTT